MYLQGNLQAVFDALYHMGVIDPVLEMDWGQALDEMTDHADDFFQVMVVANNYQDDVQELMANLKKFDQQTLSYLAMEVAREYADYHSRETLH
ncbi:MAG: cytochrome [Bdellovibrionales bacterium]|nr:cytochrome [Bdellovibrionales bacterium]